MRRHPHLQELLAAWLLRHEGWRVHTVQDLGPWTGKDESHQQSGMDVSVKVSGELAVMKEIANNGPVVCRVCDSTAFVSYSRGIFSDPGACQGEQGSRKYVVLAGWGTTRDGVKYWIGRNSWGTYWGEKGWFKLKMADGDLGVTRECHWATPVKPVYTSLIDEHTSQVESLRNAFQDLTVSAIV